MRNITIPKKITKGTDLVVISKKDYERLLAAKAMPDFKPTAKDKKDLARARLNRTQGNFLTLDELKKKLGFTN